MSTQEKSEYIKKLQQLAGGIVRANTSETRGHCKRIINIYNMYLTGWFSNVLSPKENYMMQDLFRSLDEFDGVMIKAIEKTATWLEKSSAETLDFINNGQIEKANKKIQKEHLNIIVQRRRIADALVQMRRLQEDFLIVSGAIGGQ